MKNSLNRTLIEATIRNFIKQIKNDPERSMRNLIDMALSFTTGRFQKYFFEAAQTMLKKENSCYYKIIPDLVSNADMERIVTVGMNVGYNSCTFGAQTIRKIEAAEHFNIPWTISLELDRDSYHKNSVHYHSILSEGKDMGIYTWQIHIRDNPSYILELAEEFPECAFIIFCTPENITQSLLDYASNIYNILFLIEYGPKAEEACLLLRSQGYLYSVFYNNENPDFDTKQLDEILSDTENLNSVFTVLLSWSLHPQTTTALYQYVQQLRSAQKYRTIPFDFIHDTNFIDSIISEQVCSIQFTADGICHSLVDNKVYQSCNLFCNSLCDILKTISLPN